jgi:uncharacterized protein (DUF1330 family)
VLLAPGSPTEGGAIAGYVIAEIEIEDAERYEDYKRLVPATLEAFGGRFVVRGGKTEVLEGDWTPGRLVVLEFPSVEEARAWYESDEYREAKLVRQRYSTATLLLVEGVPAPSD